MFAFRVGWIEMACVVFAAVVREISPSESSGLDQTAMAGSLIVGFGALHQRP